MNQGILESTRDFSYKLGKLFCDERIVGMRSRCISSETAKVVTGRVLLKQPMAAVAGLRVAHS